MDKYAGLYLRESRFSRDGSVILRGIDDYLYRRTDRERDRERESVCVRQTIDAA